MIARRPLRWLTDAEARALAAAVDRLIPPDDAFPGAAAGAVQYADGLLAAFLEPAGPPAIWARTTSGDGSRRAPRTFLELSPWEEQAWRTRVEGPGGWQERYRDGLHGLGADFVDVDGEEQDERLAADPDLRWLLYRHACEATYGDPVYGGNRDGLGWRSIGFPGDPFLTGGYTAEEVSGRD
jgi:gluconate 2-dehydrogenase gamma chain